MRRHSSLILAFLLAATLACAPARSAASRAPAAGGESTPDSSKTTRRQVTELAPGVYAIRHPDAPDSFPQGNTTVVIGERELLVVDSCYLPSSGREDIAQIRQWTNKPVRYLVNTHWHFDHTMGNAAYLDAFPSIAIVAHVETTKRMAAYDPGWLERFPGRAARFRAMVAAGKDEAGKPLSEAEKTGLVGAAKGVEPVAAELALVAPRSRDLTPTVSFERELEIDLGHRRVQLLFLGRGNTLGDAVVYLPDDAIVATGDLLDHPVPYLGGGYPVELIDTLERLALLDARTFVPGHGNVLQNREHLTAVIAFLKTIVAAVDRELQRSPNRADGAAIKKAVLASLDVSSFRTKFGGTDPDDRDFFDDIALGGAIMAAHAEMWPR